MVSIETPFSNLFEKFEETPINLAERGIPQNTDFSHVPVAFLNGYINLVDVKRVIMVERNTEFNTEKIDRLKMRLMNQFDVDYNDYSDEFEDTIDDIILFGETVNSYWYFWLDQDRSDHNCNIGRISKDKVEDIDEFKRLFIEFLDICDYYNGHYTELPTPQGWISL